MFSNQPHSLITELKNSLQLASLHNHRVLLLLAGVDDQSFSTICDELKRRYRELDNQEAMVIQETDDQRTANIMHLTERHSNSDSSDHINALLGTEHTCLFFDAHGVFNERLFAACAGTVVGGGTLLLRTPALACWAEAAEKSGSSDFINRLIRKIKEHKTSVVFENTAPENASATISTAVIIADKVAPSHKPELVQFAANQDWKKEQEQLVNQLITNLLDDRQSTIVVQADRGRGKSTLIGLALNQLLADEHGATKSITITANRLSACKVLLRHASATTKLDHRIRFVSLDQALAMQHDVLVIEEAGSISIPVLTKLTGLSKHSVFATTVQGYEGAGRGFALRFAKQLDQIRPDWVMLNPSQPIRWSENDPLEAFINDAFLLNTTLPAIAKSDELTSDKTQLIQVDKHELSTNDQLLEEIYSLLIQAHYQTTPADLRNMIDQEQLLIFAQRCKNILTGAALVALEGDIPEALHEAVVHKERRLHDQILPQMLAQCAAETNVLFSRYARIVRIAVHPTLHRRGFGTSLFEQLREQLSIKTGTLGASFGADEQALSFWLTLGLIPIHYGYKANPRSGLRSACLVMSDRATADQANVHNAIDRASHILHKNLSVLDSHSHDADSVRQLLIRATTKSNATLSEAEVSSLLTDFSQKRRSFIDTAGFIPLESNMFSQQSLTASQRDTIEQHMLTLLQQSALTKPKQRRVAENAVREFILQHWRL